MPKENALLSIQMQPNRTSPVTQIESFSLESWVSVKLKKYKIPEERYTEEFLDLTFEYLPGKQIKY